jgi:hypothetical protein
MSIPRLLTERLQELWCRRFRHEAALSPDRVRELTSALAAEKQALQHFTASLEEEFLRLGELLSRITSLAREVRGRSGGIENAAGGRAEDAALQFAFQLLKKAEDLVHASREQYACVFQVFGKMQADLALIARERESLMRTLSPLGTTNTQFRIQACAFDEHTRARFFALADAISGIANDVWAAVGQRFEELDRTGQAAGELVARLTALAAGQRGETERMLGETRAHLSALSEALSSSERAALSISETGAGIAGGVATAIMALQCQDITRQKLQHIGAAIDEMIGHLASESVCRISRSEAADRRHFLGAAARVQLSQLRAVFEQLDTAARQISTAFAEVESEARSLSEHALQSGVATLDREIIKRAVGSIHAVLAVIDNAISSIRTVVELVGRLKSTFSDCTSEILGLALRLRIVALNAQIFAAHVEAGAALEVVARNTCTIADLAMVQLAAISSQVSGLAGSVVELEQRLGDYSQLAAMEQALLTGEAGESESKLRTLEQDLRGAMAAMVPIERELADTIQRAKRCIRFPAAVAEAGTRSTGMFEQLAVDYPDPEGAHRKVQDLKRNYTMAHERALHEAAIASNAAAADSGDADNAPAPAHTEEAHSGTEKAADGVELF